MQNDIRLLLEVHSSVFGLIQNIYSVYENFMPPFPGLERIWVSCDDALLLFNEDHGNAGAVKGKLGQLVLNRNIPTYDLRPYSNALERCFKFHHDFSLGVTVFKVRYVDSVALAGLEVDVNNLRWNRGLDLACFDYTLRDRNPEWIEALTDELNKTIQPYRYALDLDPATQQLRSVQTELKVQLAHEWIQLRAAEGGPTADQFEFVNCLVTKGGHAVAEDIAQIMGKDWQDVRRSTRYLVDAINTKLEKQSQHWRLAAEDRGEVVIVHRPSP